jgi:hypothetical protein
VTSWWFVAAVLLVAVGVLLLVWARLRKTAARVQPVRPVPPGLLDEGLFTPVVEPAPKPRTRWQ